MLRPRFPRTESVRPLNRRQLLRQLPSWPGSTQPILHFLAEPGAPTDDDWMVLSKAFVETWNFPTKSPKEAPCYGFSKLRKPLQQKPYLANGKPLRDDQGLWLTFHGTPVAYLVSPDAYHRWVRQKRFLA